MCWPLDQGILGPATFSCGCMCYCLVIATVARPTLGQQGDPQCARAVQGFGSSCDFGCVTLAPGHPIPCRRLTAMEERFDEEYDAAEDEFPPTAERLQAAEQIFLVKAETD